MTTGTALITGTSGFLGSHCARHFRDIGWDVIGLDRTPPQSALDGVQYESCTLPHPRLQHIISAAVPRVILHAAGPASVPSSVADPSGDFSHSVIPFQYLLETVRTYSPRSRVIFLSSAAVYGSPNQLPVAEDAPIHPLSPYGFHKRLCELLADEYRTVYGLTICCLRIFSAYGVGLRKQVMWDICRKAMRQEQVTLHGTGDESRDFVHAHDIAKAIALVSQATEPIVPVYNLASGQETTIRHLAKALLSAMGIQKPIVFNGIQRKGDPLRWQADVERLAAMGFKPSTTMDIGIAEYAHWASLQHD